MHDAASPPPPTPIWDRLRAMFGRVIAVIGVPAAIALLSLTARAQRVDIVRQLLQLESLVRKILVADAAAIKLPREQLGPRLVAVPLRTSAFIAPFNQVARRPRRQGAARALDLAHPETWPAQFALSLPRDPQSVSHRAAPRIRTLWGHGAVAPAPLPAPRPRRATPFLIARRFEALRRVLNDPAPHALRLAYAQRRIINRSPRAMLRYAMKGPRTYVFDPHDPRLTIEAFALALAAFPNTS